MSRNKLARFEEIKYFDNVVQAPFHLMSEKNFYLRGSWAAKYFRNSNPIILEIGCGRGEYSVALAEKNPDKNYIGIDIKGARLWKGAKAALDKELDNVAFLRTHVEIINKFFAPDEVETIWITFPDPQMKKYSKRLTSTVFIDRYRKILKPGGTIHLKTDSRFQFIYSSSLAHLNGFEVLVETSDLYNSDFLDDTLIIKTYYEKQWLSRGIAIKYISFRLNNKDLKEPDIVIEKDSYRSFGRSARVN
ncbi:MAG: tRNA (guanosine(46)-N7)-methyltransferase TrmB [Prolixibacteraceae bacterium]|nr:tRNA (guanosine(46)-N7)-methyltransferase TrmB [Prolixibacteraceae bacterium]MDD4754479.1 tRNA (guanosine(46)-N7)-methyltransferase TrmB [Prolixibacteraceae bacterium]NLO03115.1 tRNA (guanosine(46)-N7)-methyltransferase TrmB [Bacteroidales bacterium]